MRAFHYSRPSTLSDILDRLAADAEARPLAGGMTLLPTLKQRLAQPSELVDLAGVPFLRDIEVDGDELVVGAMATHRDVYLSPLVQEMTPELAAVARTIGDVQVRNRGTIGGSVANNDPAADYPAAVLALQATVVTDRREIAAEDFFTGLFQTSLEMGELVVHVRFPRRWRGAYEKFRHPVSGYAMAGVFVAADAAGEVRVAVTGAGPGVFRERAMEQALTQDFRGQAALTVEVDPSSLSADMHAGAAYRAQLIRVLTARAVDRLASTAPWAA